MTGKMDNNETNKMATQKFDVVIRGAHVVAPPKSSSLLANGGLKPRQHVPLKKGGANDRFEADRRQCHHQL